MAIILHADDVPEELRELFEPIPHTAERRLVSVHCINPEPYGGDHFAAYPTRLVLPLIKMATSERGCCPACGAPLERVLEKVALKRERPNKLTKRQYEPGTGNAMPNDHGGVATRTKGWRRTCSCPEFDAIDKAVPCRVLDPFGGTGTTAVVSEAIGRDCTIVELFPEYLAQAEKRVKESRWQPPPDPRTGKRKRVTETVAAGQPSLFEVKP